MLQYSMLAHIEEWDEPKRESDLNMHAAQMS